MRILLSILILAFAAILPAQPVKFHNHPLSKEWEGTRLLLMYEGRSGFLWVGSDNGVFQYNGLDYRHFPCKDSSGEQTVTALLEDKTGRLWAGYADGAIRRRNYQPEMSLWLPEEGLPKVAITGLAEDSEGNIWIATYGEGLYMYRQNRMFNFNTDDGLPGNDIYTLVIDTFNRVWIGTDGGISLCSIKEGKKSIKNIGMKQGLPDEIVRALIPDKQGNLWVGTYDKGVCYFNTSKWRFEYPLSSWLYGVVGQLELFEGKELWIGTEAAGMVVYDFASRTLQQVRCSEHSLKAKVYDLHKDLEGNMWVINNLEGLCSGNRQFSFVEGRLNGIQAVKIDHQHRLWVGSQFGLFLYEKAGVYSPQLANIQLNVLSFYEDEYNNLWIGTFGQGVYCYNPDSKSLRHITEKDGLTNGSVLSIDGTAGQVWLATLGGVTAFSFRQDPCQGGRLDFHNFNKESGLGTNFIYKTFVDSQGRVWFGADGKGLSMLDKNGRIVNYNKTGKVDIQSVHAIVEDKQGHIWFGTAKQGVFEFDGKQFTQLTFKQGLRNQAINGLATDPKGNILIVHASGIDLLNPQTKHIIYYGEEVGIHQIDPNLNTLDTDAAGNIWIGAQHEVICYTYLKENLSIHPRTHITGVSVFLEPIDFLRNNTFNYDQNSLVFEFVGLWFTNPSGVKYRYKLQGYNFDWVVTADRRAVYSNLRPGTYTLMVMATENDAFSQEPMATYTFVILKPLWLRWWFIALCTMALAALVYFLINQRDKRLQREAALKRSLIESQYESLKSQINPHFLFNSFNTLITIIDENPKAAVEYVEKLSDFYRSILQYREKDVIPLQEELALVDSFSFLLKKRFGDNFLLQINAKVNGETLFIAPLTLQILVENAVKHNVISKSKPLKISIERNAEDDIVVQNTLQRKLTPERSTGFGLHSIIHRYEMLSNKKIKVVETDTTYTVSIPLIKNDKA